MAALVGSAVLLLARDFVRRPQGPVHGVDPQLRCGCMICNLGADISVVVEKNCGIIYAVYFTGIAAHAPPIATRLKKFLAGSGCYAVTLAFWGAVYDTTLGLLQALFNDHGGSDLHRDRAQACMDQVSCPTVEPSASRFARALKTKITGEQGTKI